MVKTHFEDDCANETFCEISLVDRNDNRNDKPKKNIFISSEPAHVDCMACLKERLRRIKEKESPYEKGVFCGNCNKVHEFNGECA